MAAAPPEPAGPPDDLTERELEILRLIALGHTNAEIGKQLYLSVRTVESHRAHMEAHLVNTASIAALNGYCRRARRTSRRSSPCSGCSRTSITS
jgi:DNA-binding CsgD family transcriptional regulator